MKSLQTAFEEYKESESFAVLKEDIRRQEKLYEVMNEGGLFKYV